MDHNDIMILISIVRLAIETGRTVWEMVTFKRK